MPTGRRSLISDLERAVQTGSKVERIDTLRRITDLFLSTSERLSAEQIDVFDEVLGHLIRRLEARTLSELSERLAPIDNAPPGVLRTLAFNDEIAVAGPVLSVSDKLSSSDLIEIASSKSQQHLLAIAGRRALEIAITDVLVERGDLNVCRKLAANSDARFSEDGIGQLVERADGDDALTERLGVRADLPLHLMRQLLSNASELVREVLMRTAPVTQREEIRNILNALGDDVVSELPVMPDFEYANFVVRQMHDNGELDEVALLQFVKSNRYAESVAAMALLCDAPHDILDRIFRSNRSEALIVPCRAADLAWPTVRALMLARRREHCSADTIEELKSDYTKLSIATAQRVLRFWCKQQATGKDILSS